MKCALLLLLLPLCALAAEHDHAAMQQDTPVPATHDHTAMSATIAAAGTSEALATTMMEHGGMSNYLLLADRFERQFQNDNNLWVWDAQGWYGGDYDKLWVKTAGEWSDLLHEVGHSELQVLYSHAIAPFWNLQTGVRHDDGTGKSRSYGVLGFQGLAPYWFEIDSAAFVSERGDLQLHYEAGYEVRLTQKLLLQPRVQLNHAFASDTAAGIEQGLFDSNIALRLRYEFVREFAPYIGVEHAIGRTATANATRMVFGIRFWY